MGVDSHERTIAEDRRQRHRLYWRHLWFLLFVASTLIALLFAYAWWETDRLLRDFARSVKEDRVLRR